MEHYCDVSIAAREILYLKEHNAALLTRIKEFDSCIQKIAIELGGVCCGGVDVDQTEPGSTTAVLVAAIRKLRNSAGGEI